MMTKQANEVCTADKKSTVMPEHVLKAMKHLEMEEWVPDLEQALAAHKEASKGPLCRRAQPFAAATLAFRERLVLLV